MPGGHPQPFEPPSEIVSHVVWALVVAALSTAVWYFFARQPASPEPGRPITTIGPPQQEGAGPRALAPRVGPEMGPATRGKPPDDVALRRFTPSAPRESSMSIYLCRSYQDARFWSSEHCHSQQALIERIHRVPTALSWPQQVEIANREAQQAAALYRPAPTTITASRIGPGTDGDDRADGSKSATCESIAAYIRSIDAVTRQPLSASRQDYYRRERQKLMSQAHRLRC